MENITLEAIVNMNPDDLMILVKLKEALDKAQEDYEFLKEKIKFSIGEYRIKYKTTPAPDPKNPRLLFRPNCGEITHAGAWRFEDCNAHLYQSPLSNVSSANVYEVKLSVEGIFSLYRAKALVDMGHEAPKDEGTAAYIKAKFDHFREFIGLVENFCEFQCCKSDD